VDDVFSGGRSELDTIEYPVLYSHYATGATRMATGRSDLTVVAFVKDVPLAGGAAVANGLPSIISGRGYYTYLTVSAMTYRNGVMRRTGSTTA